MTLFLLILGCSLPQGQPYELTEISGYTCDAHIVTRSWPAVLPEAWKLPKEKRDDIDNKRIEDYLDAGCRYKDTDPPNPDCEVFRRAYKVGSGQWCCEQSGGSFLGYRGENAVCR